MNTESIVYRLKTGKYYSFYQGLSSYLLGKYLQFTNYEK